MQRLKIVGILIFLTHIRSWLDQTRSYRCNFREGDNIYDENIIFVGVHYEHVRKDMKYRIKTCIYPRRYHVINERNRGSWAA